MSWSLSALLEGLPGCRRVAGDDATVGQATLDSREVVPGSLFLARQGERVDGHAHVASALAAGAAGLLVEHPERVSPDVGVPVWQASLDDAFIAQLGARLHRNPTRALTVHAVTGTNGKTSTVAIVAHLLRALGERPAVVGTTGHVFEGLVRETANTTPDGLTLHGFAAEALGRGATALVLEASSHGLALGRMAGVHPDVVAFTNLGHDHLDFHGNFAAYAEAKGRLFGEYAGAAAAAGKHPVGVVSGDDPMAASMLARLPAVAERWWCTAAGGRPGPEGALCLALGPVGPWRLEGTRLALEVRRQRVEIDSPFVGAWQVSNAAVALGMVLARHPDAGDVLAAALADFPGVPGRMETVLPQGTGPIVLVDYAHTPGAVSSVLETLRGAGAHRTTVVLGCGGGRDREKRAPMAAAALAGAAHVVLTSDNPRGEPAEAILQDMLSAVPEEASGRVTVEADRTEAIAAALDCEADAILVAGKGHERTQEIGGRRYALSDREEVRRLVAGRVRGWSAGESPLLCGWSAERLARALEGELVAPGQRLLGPLVLDSREVASGDIFVALRGEQTDGHRWVGAASAAGAGAIVVERAPDEPVRDAAVIRVASAPLAMGRLATAVLAEARARQCSLTTIGITGSNGKTTTKELLAHLCALDAPVLATPGNWNNHLGLPLTVSRIGAGHRVAVLEMGANRPDDIAELAAIAAPDIMVVTSIGDAHLEGFGGTRDAVRRAKAGFLRTGIPPRLTVLPATELEAWGTWLREAGTTTWTFGAWGSGATLEWERSAPRARVRLRCGAWDAEMALSLPGAHQASNLAASVLAEAGVRALRSGAWAGGPGELLAPSELADHLQRLPGVPGGRQRRLQIEGRVLVDDAYNANPSSMRASLEILAAEAGPRVAVLGPMRELGAASIAAHREVGHHAAQCADRVVVVGADAESAALAEGAGARAEHVAAVEDAAVALSDVVPGTTVLLKGSRSCRLEALIPLVSERWRED